MGRAADALGNALRSSNIADLPDEGRKLLELIKQIERRVVVFESRKRPRVWTWGEFRKRMTASSAKRLLSYSGLARVAAPLSLGYDYTPFTDCTTKRRTFQRDRIRSEAGGILRT
jgi:hypothetical protein